MAAVRDGAAEFVSPAEMREWLASDDIAAFTDLGEWPTAETAALWQRFRIEILSGGAQKWTVGSFTRRFDVPDGLRHPKPGLYRVETDPGEKGKTWLTTPDYRRLVPFRKSLSDPKPSLIVARVLKTNELAVASGSAKGKRSGHRQMRNDGGSMATTAYSRRYAREIDVEQLTGLLRGTQPNSAEQASDIDPKWSDWIRSDIQCSSCGRLGAQVVRSARAGGTKKLIRQSHFRFVGRDGQDAHHPFCEFYGEDGGHVTQSDGLVNLGSEKSAETRLIRQLVCKGHGPEAFRSIHYSRHAAVVL